MKGTFKLGKVAGVPVYSLDIFVTYCIYCLYHRTGYNAIQILWSVVFVLCIFVTVVMHELDMRSPLKLWNTNKRHHIASHWWFSD
jgi:hypothetical protein